ncbi:hypothetical protein VaNZ11_015470, partial [Volvox africanus]
VAAAAAAAAATSAGVGYRSEHPMSCLLRYVVDHHDHLCASRGSASETLPVLANDLLPHNSSASTSSVGGSNFTYNHFESAPDNNGNILHHRPQDITSHGIIRRPCQVGYYVAAPPADVLYFTACMLGRSPKVVENAAVEAATITDSLLFSMEQGCGALGSSVCSDGGPTTPNCGGGGGLEGAVEPCLRPAEGPCPTNESSGIMLYRPSIPIKGLTQMLETFTVGNIERPVATAAAAAAAAAEAEAEGAAEVAVEAAAVAEAARIPSSSSLLAVSPAQCQLTSGVLKSPPPSQLREAHGTFRVAAAACRNLRRLVRKPITCCLFPDWKAGYIYS